MDNKSVPLLGTTLSGIVSHPLGLLWSAFNLRNFMLHIVRENRAVKQPHWPGHHNLLGSSQTMTTIRPFRAEDLFKFNHVNLDPLTETYNIPFYMQYVATWPSLCASFDDPNGRMMGYILGKAEGDSKLWHGHVTAVTVSPEYRRLGVAKNLMAYLVRISQCL